MNKQIVQPVKGTRDFYPEQMAFRNYLYGKIREFAEKFGYQEVDGPILEYFDLYANKTSQEILEGQTFTISARGEQTIILRPEFTPTYARMVAQRSQELLKPIRWFSFGRTFRYEQPQKGRTREFFQLEVNPVVVICFFSGKKFPVKLGEAQLDSIFTCNILAILI